MYIINNINNNKYYNKYYIYINRFCSILKLKKYFTVINVLISIL